MFSKHPKGEISKKMLAWCVHELQYKAKKFEEVAGVSIFNGDVVKSDDAISNSLRVMLQSAVSSLEIVGARHIDWHPDPHGQILDLVNPFLFPLVFGRTRVLPATLTTLEDFAERCGEGVVVPIPSTEETTILTEEGLVYYEALDEPYSTRFQWLPSDVDISGNDGNVR
jgi:hypothetical protein